MQQHAIPQNVTQYQFRLVGDMTLKQFLELAGGLLLAYLFFASNLIFIFKWPLVIFSVLLGVGLAFFPVEDRPLDQWIVNFVRAIYGPTRFIWKKSDKIPRLFTFSPHPVTVVNTITKTIKGPVSLSADEVVSDLSPTEVQRLAALDTLFAASPLPAESLAKTGSTLPATHFSPTVSVRKLKPQADVTASPGRLVRPAAPPTLPAESLAKAGAVTPIKTESVIFTSKPSATASQTTAPAVPSAQLKSIKLPSPPRLPGLVVGAVVDQNGKLVENAIVELISADGIPQRAMKTNPLGQFYTATPLSTGTYTIEVDKAGLTFSPQQLQVTTSIIPPFELRATS